MSKIRIASQCKSSRDQSWWGNHSYSGLALTDKEYNSIPDVQTFAPLNYLLLLIIPLTATAIETLQMIEQHNEQKDFI